MFHKKLRDFYKMTLQAILGPFSKIGMSISKVLTLMYVQYCQKTLVVESKTKQKHFQFNHFETKIFLVLNLSVCRFSLQYLWKRAVRITERPYTHQRERLFMLWGNPVIFTDCGENPMIHSVANVLRSFVFL